MAIILIISIIIIWWIIKSLDYSFTLDITDEDIYKDLDSPNYDPSKYDFKK